MRRKLAILKAMRQEQAPLQSVDTDVEMAPASSSSGESTSTATTTHDQSSMSLAITTGTEHDVKLRRMSNVDEKQKALPDTALTDPETARHAAKMVRMMNLCDDIE